MFKVNNKDSRIACGESFTSLCFCKELTLSKYSNIFVIHLVNKHLLYAYFLYFQMLGKYKQMMAA